MTATKRKDTKQTGKVDFFDFSDSSGDELPVRITAPTGVDVGPGEIPLVLADRMSTLSISSPCPSDVDMADSAPRAGPSRLVGGTKQREVIELSD